MSWSLSKNCVAQRTMPVTLINRSTSSLIYSPFNPNRITPIVNWFSNCQTFFCLLFSVENRFFFIPIRIFFSVNSAWERFQDMFTTIEGMLMYEPIYKAFHIRLLEELHEDNVMYAELRTGLSPVNSVEMFSISDSFDTFSFRISTFISIAPIQSYWMWILKLTDENGKILNSEQVVELLMKLVNDFKMDHPLFLGVKVILTISRNSDVSSWEVKMQRFIDLQQKYPNFVIGFDLVGQEDNGKNIEWTRW